MIKKDAQDLVERLDDIHARLEDIIQDYMNEYATYGWDATCTVHRHCKYSGFCRLRDVTAEIRKGGGLA